MFPAIITTITTHRLIYFTGREVFKYYIREVRTQTHRKVHTCRSCVEAICLLDEAYILLYFCMVNLEWVRSRCCWVDKRKRKCTHTWVLTANFGWYASYPIFNSINPINATPSTNTIQCFGPICDMWVYAKCRAFIVSDTKGVLINQLRREGDFQQTVK